MLASNAADRTSAVLRATAVRATAVAIAACLGSGVACVDTGDSADASQTSFDAPQASGGSGGAGAVAPGTCELPEPAEYSGDAGIPFEDTTTPGPYA
ncbi:MAG TPA: hypothetical protein VJ801_16395, partial [Polyangia bacterium]|nr:hypothetical protein [Polyangia bacterium]